MLTKADYANMQGLLDPERMHYANRRPTLAEIVAAVDALAAEEAEVLDIQKEIDGVLRPKPGGRPTRFDRETMSEARNDLTFLTNGFTRDVHVGNVRLRGRAGLPGLAALDRLKVRLEKLRDREVERTATPWPRPFAYTGRPGEADFDGRFLEPGDVVELTESQALAFADRFAPVAAS